MNFSRYYRNEGEFIYGFDPGIIDIETDSDGDGISDYYEEHMVMFNGITLVMDKNNPDTDGDGISDGKEVAELKYEYNEDKTKVIVTGKVLSSPIEKDTDYDGISDNEDELPLSGKFTGAMLGYYDVTNADYTMNYRSFFDASNSYDESICSASLIFANTIYEEGGFTYETGGNGTITSIKQLMEYHGFDNVIDYSLATTYNDDDVSEIGIGTHEVTYNGKTINVLAVIIRGTNETIKEWSSNFDMGDPDSWDSEYHKGFYTTEERIREYVKHYIATYIKDTSNLVYWITGHSRGAALSNILAAKLIDDGNKVFAYTFATPSTTISSTKNDSKYNSIVNFANTRDIVTYVPLEQWGFGRFGVDIKLDISDLNLDATWKYRTGQTEYNALEESLIDLVLDRITRECASTWSEVFDYSGDQNISDDQYSMISERAKRYCKIEERTSIFGKHKGYKLYPSTAFFFQLGAEMLAGTDAERENVKELISEFWNSKYAWACIIILKDIGKEDDVALPDSLGESLVGDGHAPATYYVLTRDSYIAYN